MFSVRDRIHLNGLVVLLLPSIRNVKEIQFVQSWPRDFFVKEYRLLFFLKKKRIGTADEKLHPISTLIKLKLHQIANFLFYQLLFCCPNIRHLALSKFDVGNVFINRTLPLTPIKLESFYSSSSDTVTQALAIQKTLGLRQFNRQPVMSTHRCSRP